MDNIGFLVYNDVTNRFAVRGQEITDLHCGDCVTLKLGGEYVPSRVEMDSSDNPLYGWYFVGIGKCALHIGKTVEINK